MGFVGSCGWVDFYSGGWWIFIKCLERLRVYCDFFYLKEWVKVRWGRRLDFVVLGFECLVCFRIRGRFVFSSCLFLVGVVYIDGCGVLVLGYIVGESFGSFIEKLVFVEFLVCFC